VKHDLEILKWIKTNIFNKKHSEVLHEKRKSPKLRWTFISFSSMNIKKPLVTGETWNNLTNYNLLHLIPKVIISLYLQTLMVPFHWATEQCFSFPCLSVSGSFHLTLYSYGATGRIHSSLWVWHRWKTGSPAPSHDPGEKLKLVSTEGDTGRRAHHQRLFLIREDITVCS
jgi:hypothetical protein